MSVLAYFSPKVIYKTNSLINGDIEVSEFRGRRELIIGGLQQSGDLVAKLWEETLGEVSNIKYTVSSVLLLGVGGGSVIPVLQKKFPNAHVTAVEIDPEIVDVGKKYFRLGKHSDVDIVVDDAFDFVQKKGRYDLVLVDTYAGSTIPPKIRSRKFLENVNRICAAGVVVFNHIRSTKEEERKAGMLEKQLKAVYEKVSYVDVLVNRLFICSN